MATLSLLLSLTLICLTLSTAQAATSLTALTPTTTTTAAAAAYQTMNSSSSCIPFILKMTICLDFLVTGSIQPVPSDSCCLRLKWIGEIDFPCLCNILSSNKGWGRKLNHTRAETLPLSCGFGFLSADNSLKTCRRKRTLDVAENAPKPKSAVIDPPSSTHDHVDDKPTHEVPKPSAANVESHSRRLLADNILPKIA
ncbi:hypothetical protein QQ045_019590 [Rhodiola kirilowii]